jgi:hypothetical protein
MTRFYRSPSFWLTLLLSGFAVAPLLRPGYFWGAHDARHNVFFVLQYNLTWNEGILFPRWSPDWAFGYGYPFFNIYAPGATFVATLLYRLLSLSYEGAVEALFILSILLSAASMGIFVRELWGEEAALVAGVAWVYVPYHLVDIYVRAAMAESLALALLPLALWGARRSVWQPGPGAVALLALGYAAVHLSSNLVALLFSPVLAAYIAVLAWSHLPPGGSRRSRLRAWLRALVMPGLGLGLGLGLAAFFVLPALTEARYVNQEQWFGGYYDFHDHFVYFAQLFDPRWGFGISVPGPDDALSYQLGLAFLVLAVLAARYGLRRRHPHRLEVAFWLGVLVVGAWLTTAAATWAWDHVPLVAAAQFPWRYLTLAALALAILAPVVLTARRSPKPGTAWPEALLLAGLLILNSAPYLRVEVIPPPPGGATLAGLMEFERSADEMTGMTITAQAIPTWSPLADLHMAGQPMTTQVDYSRVPQNEVLAVHTRAHTVTREVVWVHAGREGLRVPFLRQWYPGWTASLFDPETGALRARFALTPDHTSPPYGLIEVPVPPGDHILELRFEDTPVRRLAETVSLLSVFVLAALLLMALRRRPAGPSLPTL